MTTETAPPPVVHLDVDTRRSLGRAARQIVPRSQLGEWAPATERFDPVALIAEQERTRVQELLPIRHERMLASPFAFYRGAANLMAADLATVPDTGLRVQCCGDAHLANFGGFAAPDRHLVFDMNDFDETSVGPFEWDVKRLVTSFELAWREAGIDPTDGRRIVANTARAYRESMRVFAGLRNIDLWYARLDVDRILSEWRNAVPKASIQRFRKSAEKARGKDSLKAFARLTEVVDGRPRIVSDPPLLVPARDLGTGRDQHELMEWLHQRFRIYRNSLQGNRQHLLESYRIVDAARKVVGVGSVGTRCWIVFLLGRDDDDPLFVQVKEANESVLEPYAGRSGYANHGQRVVEGQRLLQSASDILIGWVRAEGLDGVTRDFFLRQLWDGKLSPAYDTMTADVLRIFGEMCGWTLARGHARSGDRVAIGSYLGRGDGFDRAMAEFAAAYADQNDRDHAAVSEAVRSGRLASMR